MMKDPNDKWGMAFFVAVLAAFALGFFTGRSGIKDHAAGRYVVVAMPDGTTQVCEVKEKTDGK